MPGYVMMKFCILNCNINLFYTQYKYRLYTDASCYCIIPFAAVTMHMSLQWD